MYRFGLFVSIFPSPFGMISLELNSFSNTWSNISKNVKINVMEITKFPWKMNPID